MKSNIQRIRNIINNENIQSFDDWILLLKNEVSTLQIDIKNDLLINNEKKTRLNYFLIAITFHINSLEKLSLNVYDSQYYKNRKIKELKISLIGELNCIEYIYTDVFK